jgi:hypothetical protein
MRTLVSRFSLVLFAFFALSLSASSARAFTLDDLADLLNKLDAAGANPYPVHGSDLTDAQQLISCLENEGTSDVGVADCIAKTGKSGLGSKLGGDDASMVVDFLEFYIAFRNGDFWGVVNKIVSPEGFCIVAELMASGMDVCALIKELVEVGEALLDAGKAFAEFFAGLGEGAVEAAAEAGCAFGIGDCSSGSSSPEQIAYGWVFQPKISAGLQAREQVDASAFEKLRSQLEKNASACPAVLSLDIDVKTCPGAKAAKNASGIYVVAVDGQWSEDIAQKVAAALAKKRDEYASKPQIAIVANAAGDAYVQGKTPPAGFVKTHCSADFSTTYGFAHVDRWIMTHKDTAAGLGNLKTSLDWCEQTFWGDNKPEFTDRFHDYAKVKLCTGPSAGQSVMCETLGAYQNCVGLLASVGHSELCTANGSLVGWEAAKAIDKYFKDHHSTVPCQTPKPPPTSQSADFVCSRPPQGASCEKAYSALFGSSPQKLVNCKVNPDLDPSYKKLMAAVPGAAAKLANPHQVKFGIDAIDPLLVSVGKNAIAVLKADPNQNQGFGPPSAKSGFDFLIGPGLPRPIDGVSTPAFASAVKPELATQKGPLTLKDAVKLVQPSSPDPGQRVTKPGALTSQKSTAVKASPGSLPSAWATAKPAGATARAAGPVTAASGLTLVPAVQLGATSGTWGGSLSVPAVQARRHAGGLCEFELHYRVDNTGSTLAPATSRALQGAATPPAAARTGAIPAGGHQEIVEAVMLKPGTNQLKLRLGEASQTSAAKEFTLQAEVTGSCDAATAPGRVTPSHEAPPVRSTAPQPRAPQP